MNTYKIINPVFLHGEIHKTGTVDATAEDAQPLVDSGSLVLVGDSEQSDLGGGDDLTKDSGDLSSVGSTNISGVGTGSEVQQLSEVPGSGSETSKEDAVDSESKDSNDPESKQSENQTATLVGGITKDGRIVALNEWKVPELKKLAVELGVSNANKLNKESLIEAITAVEFAADQLEQ